MTKQLLALCHLCFLLEFIFGWFECPHCLGQKRPGSGVSYHLHNLEILDIDLENHATEMALKKEIKLKSKALSIMLHPDKGGDDEAFIIFNSSKEALLKEGVLAEIIINCGKKSAVAKPSAAPVATPPATNPRARHDPYRNPYYSVNLGNFGPNHESFRDWKESRYAQMAQEQDQKAAERRAADAARQEAIKETMQRTAAERERRASRENARRVEEAEKVEALKNLQQAEQVACEKIQKDQESAFSEIARQESNDRIKAKRTEKARIAVERDEIYFKESVKRVFADETRSYLSNVSEEDSAREELKRLAQEERKDLEARNQQKTANGENDEDDELFALQRKYERQMAGSRPRPAQKHVDPTPPTRSAMSVGDDSAIAERKPIPPNQTSPQSGNSVNPRRNFGSNRIQ